MNKPYIIGIGGGSGSGKTSFIKALREEFPDNQLCVFSMDEYYRPHENQKLDETGETNYDLPFSIDKKAFRRDLKKLIDGEVVKKEEYTFNNLDKTPEIYIFLPAPIIIVEGLFVFHYKKVRKMLDLKIFLHAKENLKVIRRIKRDKIERNYPLDDVLYRYEFHVLPSFEKYILPYKDDCDLVINNNDNFDKGLEVVKGFIKNRISK